MEFTSLENADEKEKKIKFIFKPIKYDCVNHCKTDHIIQQSQSDHIYQCVYLRALMFYMQIIFCMIRIYPL